MRFEFDPAKSAANKAKHGIDFDEAQAVKGYPCNQQRSRPKKMRGI
jgi:uncharacterized DUF497 family protein